MDQHVRLVAILNILFGCLAICVSLFILAFFGGISALIGLNAPGEEAMIAIPIMMIIGGIGAFMGLIFPLLGLISGIGLLKHKEWARILCCVISILNFFAFPIGTALGVYSMIVLFSSETSALFRAQTS